MHSIIGPIGANDAAPGDVLKVAFAKPGSYQVRCAIHPKMKIDVTVQ